MTPRLVAGLVARLGAMGRAPGEVPERVDRAIHEAVARGQAVEGLVSARGQGGWSGGGDWRSGGGWRVGSGWRIAASIALLLGLLAGWTGEVRPRATDTRSSVASRSTSVSEARDGAERSGMPALARSAPDDEPAGKGRAGMSRPGTEPVRRDQDEALAADHVRPTVVDAMLAARLAAGASLNLAASRLARLDVDADGRIDAQDARALLRRAVERPAVPSSPADDDAARLPTFPSSERGTT